jgi:hypothetical protein
MLYVKGYEVECFRYGAWVWNVTVGKIPFVHNNLAVYM